MARELTRQVTVPAPPGDPQGWASYGPGDKDIPTWALDQMGDHLFEDSEAEMTDMTPQTEIPDGVNPDLPGEGRYPLPGEPDPEPPEKTGVTPKSGVAPKSK